MCIGSHQAEGRNTTFIMGHALLKKAILHLKRANGRFILQGTVAKAKTILNGHFFLCQRNKTEKTFSPTQGYI